MCGRVAHLQPAPAVQAAVRARSFADAERYRTSYNAGPTRHMPVLVRHNGERELRAMRWGLIPGWTKPPAPPSSSSSSSSSASASSTSTSASTVAATATADPLSFRSSLNTINARDDAVCGRAHSLWHAYRQRKRCVVLADGFFEWLAVGKQRHPHFIRLPGEQRLMMFAGFYDVWKDAHGQLVYSCSVVTTSSNAQMRFLHERMPVLLTRDEDVDRWLDADVPFESASHLLRPYAGELRIDQVSTFVNKIGHDTPECVTPLSVSGVTDVHTRPITTFFSSPRKDSSSGGSSSPRKNDADEVDGYEGIDGVGNAGGPDAPLPAAPSATDEELKRERIETERALVAAAFGPDEAAAATTKRKHDEVDDVFEIAVDEAKLQQLAALGFDEQRTREALAKYCSVEAATNWLLDTA